MIATFLQGALGLTTICRHCGIFHTGQCPHVATIEYRQDGAVIVERIKYFGDDTIIDPFAWLREWKANGGKVEGR